MYELNNPGFGLNPISQKLLTFNEDRERN
jgi:hypothetical protein